MKIKLFVLFVLLMMSVGGAYGFDDSVQRYVVDYEEVWQSTESGFYPATITIVNNPVEYPSSYSIRLYSYYTSASHGDPSVAEIKSIDYMSSNYFGFTARSIDLFRDDGFQLLFNDATSDVLLATVNIGSVASSNGIGRYEIIRSGDTANYNLYINGISVQSFSLSSNVDEYRISLMSYTHWESTPGTDANILILDDFSTSSIIGITEEWTQASTYIDTSYGIRSYASFPSSVYTLTSKHVGTGTTINTTTLTSQADFVRWDRTAIYGSNWGLYHVQLFRDSTKMAETTFTYFDSTISGAVAFDSDSYSQGQTANIEYTISSADFATYTYYLKTMNVLGTVQDTYTLSAASGTKSPTLADYDSGVYYAILSRTSKTAPVTNEEFAYDYASVTESVYINGNVTEAVSGTNMQNVSIQYLQGTTYYNTTSAADGTYNVSDLSAAVSTSVDANVTYVNDSVFGNESYNLSTFSFTPLAAEIYQVDLILFDVNHTYDNVSAYGLIYDSIYHQPIESATVNIYNDTWSDSTTSTATGYYVFNDLIANGTYSINATATGYTDTIDYAINTTTINATRQDGPMSTLYTVTIKAKDATTLAYLSDFTATLDGTEGTAVNGTVTFTDVEYGLHAISAIADDYYPSATTPLIDEDTEVVLSLTRLSSQYYAPHDVTFTLKSLFGTLYSGVTTNVYIGDTASGDVYKTGVSGTEGGVVFELSEDVQYTITFIDASQSIDESITIYPAKNAYPVYIIKSLLPDDEDVETTEVVVSITQAEINSTHAYINVTYTDAMAETTDLNIYINQSNEADPQNQTVITSAALGATSSVTHSFLISDYQGQAYFINIGATHTTFDTISRTYAVKFDGMAEDYGFERFWLWLGVGGLMFLGGIFKSSKAEKGALIVCIAGWIFVGMGFFDALGSSALTGMKAGLGLATVLAIMANMSKKDRDETV